MRTGWARVGENDPGSADSGVVRRAPRTTSRAQAIALVVAIVTVLLTALLPSPYAIERPGPVFDTLGSSGSGTDRAALITISGHRTYPTSGRLDLLTVSIVGLPTGGPSWVDLAAAWLQPTDTVVPLEAIYPAGTTEQQADAQATAEMDGSQQSAVAAALIHLGYDVHPTVKVTEVQPGSAAAGSLRTGDVIESYGGRAVTDACTLQDEVLAGGARSTAITVERGGSTEALTVRPRITDIGDGQSRPLLGIATTASYTFPFRVDLQIADVGGPSAGMMFALGVIDKLTPGSLTGGRHVAGTGTICGDGSVGPIGGIVQKMAAARSAGATLFLAPAGDCDEVVGHIPGGLTVVPVKTLSDSLDTLERVRARGSTAGLPTCAAQVASAG